MKQSSGFAPKIWPDDDDSELRMEMDRKLPSSSGPDRTFNIPRPSCSSRERLHKQTLGHLGGSATLEQLGLARHKKQTNGSDAHHRSREP